MTSDADLAGLIAAVRAAPDAALLVVTGAGVSLASGIPTFRGSDPDAVWARDVTELGTNAYFRRDPVGSWRWYLARFGRLAGARPNAAHVALAALERWQLARGGRFLLVTQNVDGLHAAAGSRELVEVHGRADRVRCARMTCALGAPRGSIARANVSIAAFLADPCDANVPRCPQCRARLRQHVLWFDERYTGHADYQWARVRQAANRARVVLFVGTSFSVGVTAFILERARRHLADVFSIDPGGAAPEPRVRVIAAPAEQALPAVVAALTTAA